MSVIILAIAIIVIQGALLVQVQPYYLAYFNPAIFGGQSHTPDIVLVGWGEGLNLAADYLNAKPNASNIVVAAQYHGFASYYNGKTIDMLRTNGNISGSDYVVFYVSMVQRHWNYDLWNEYQNRTPEKVIRINDMDYCWIYKTDPNFVT